MALRLVGEVTLDGAGFERGLRKIGTSAAENLKSFVVGAFGIYGVEEAIRRTTESATELVNKSKALGITVEQLQVMRQAAKDGGVEFDKLTASMSKLNAIRENILNGGKGAAAQMAALLRLGVTPDMLAKQTAGQLELGPIAATINQKNPADIANDLKTIFGKSFEQLIPVLATDFDGLAGKMQKLGIIMDTETAVKMKYLGDETALVSQILVTQAAPLILKFADAVIFAIGKIKEGGSFWGAAFAKFQMDPNQANPSKTLGERIRRALGEGTGAAIETETDWVKQFADLNAKLAEEANKLKHPIPPDTSPGVPILPHQKAFRTSEDSLISVGNFLGSGRGAITGIAEQHLEVSRQQLTTQQKMAASLDKIANRQPTDEPQDWGDGP